MRLPAPATCPQVSRTLGVQVLRLADPVTREQAITKAVERFGKVNPSADDVLTEYLCGKPTKVRAGNGRYKKAWPCWDEHTMGVKYHRLASEVIRRTSSPREAKPRGGKFGGRGNIARFTVSELEWIEEMHELGYSVNRIRRKLAVGFGRVKSALEKMGYDPKENSGTYRERAA